MPLRIEDASSTAATLTDIALSDLLRLSDLPDGFEVKPAEFSPNNAPATFALYPSQTTSIKLSDGTTLQGDTLTLTPQGSPLPAMPHLLKARVGGKWVCYFKVIAETRSNGAAPGFIRGDCNDDRMVDISDGIFNLNSLFAEGSSQPNCVEACNANNDAMNDISGEIFLFRHLFANGQQPTSSL